MNSLSKVLMSERSRRRLLSQVAALAGGGSVLAAGNDARAVARDGLGSSEGARAMAAATPLPAAIAAVMEQPRYAGATWGLLVSDLATGEPLFEHNADRRLFTASVRKLFSVGLALDRLGADHRFTTPVYRRGDVDGQGTLDGDLILVAAGDLTLGGRVTAEDEIAYTDFDHNDANGLGTAILTPQDPLRGLDDLARQVKAAGIQIVSGEVIVDDRLFEPFIAPNQKLPITPIMVNENQIDVTVTPTTVGKAAAVTWRPETEAFTLLANVTTSSEGTPATVARSDSGRITCIGEDGCAGTVTGEIPVGFQAPLSRRPELIQTFQIEEPTAFARTAFIEALQRAGVEVAAPGVAANPAGALPEADAYAPDTQVAEFVSPPYAEFAKLILKVSLNLGANVSLMLFGLTQGKRTVNEALAVERETLIDQVGLVPDSFMFPTNGSGTPDSEATARAVVQVLTAMSQTDVAAAYRAALPILGEDGSLAEAGRDLPGKGHVLAKTGTTLDASGIKVQNLAGYIDAKSGRQLAFALLLNDAGPIEGIEDVLAVIEDEAAITSAIYELG